MRQELKPYMGYSRALGAPEGAILIFANDRREAKKLGWGIASGMLTDEYIDFDVRLMKDKPHLFEQARKDTPHVIDSPDVCPKCNLWGEAPAIDSEGNLCCELCVEDEY